MKNMSPVADETQYISAKDVRNKRKNRFSNILPGMHLIICIILYQINLLTVHTFSKLMSLSG